MTMKSLFAGLLAVTLFLSVSCGENDPSSAQNNSPQNTLAGAADMSKSKPAAGAPDQQQGAARLPQEPIERSADGSAATASNAPAAAAAADTSDMPQVPKDARWTLYCAVLKDPDHVNTA